MRCVQCERPIRAAQQLLKDHPGTVASGARGKCRTCHMRGNKPRAWAGQELLAEIDHIQDHPENVLRRLNVTAAAVEKAAYRHGRPDIARQFSQLIRRTS